VEPLEPAPRAAQAAAAPLPAAPVPDAVREPPPLRDGEDWHRLVAGLGLGGVARELAGNCQFADWDGGRLVLTLDPDSRHMWVATAEERLRDALSGVLGPELRLEIRVARPEQETPAQRRVRQQAERMAEAQAVMEADPVARALQDGLGARWVPGTIEPAD
jgi:DNA polymerase-3 subunit gamma/tau